MQLSEEGGGEAYEKYPNRPGPAVVAPKWDMHTPWFAVVFEPVAHTDTATTTMSPRLGEELPATVDVVGGTVHWIVAPTMVAGW